MFIITGSGCLPVWTFLLIYTARALSTVPDNEEILMDSIQINPGDPYGNQPTKYSDARYLKGLGYTARSSSMEQTPALCIDFKAADRVSDGGIFSSDRNMLAWTRMYCHGIDRLIQETTSEGLDMHFFTDMIVFPTPLLRLYPEVLRENTTSTILYNNYTEYLLEIMFDEWFERFPLTDGIVIRTGETYTFDTPYHLGSSPTAGVGSTGTTDRRDIWIAFLNLLRTVVCTKHGRKVVFRTWDSLLDVDSYLDVTDSVTPHPHLYFAVKHTSGDFFRQMAFNELLGRGKHAQIIEVQIQREYEGKGAYPLYIFEHVILGDESSDVNKSLSSLFPTGRNESSLIKGLWTWSRGGGWWGPYIHGAEFWIDLNLNMFVEWWISNCTITGSNVADLFADVCERFVLPSTPHVSLHSHNIARVTASDLLGSPRDACTSLHEAVLLADRAMLFGRYCMESERPIYSGCWIWTRDDRIGGFGALNSHLKYLQGNETRVVLSLSYKTESVALWKRSFNIYNAQVGPLISTVQPRLGRQIQSSFLYAQCYFCIIESAWRAMIHGVLGDNSTRTDCLVHLAISDYDECWVEYRALALSIPEFPSLYKGNSWNFPFQSEPDGIDASINKLRRLVVPTDETIGDC